MTPDEARRQWYQEMAHDAGVKARVHMIAPRQFAEALPAVAAYHARLAAHFGRLALGRVELTDKDEWVERTKEFLP